MGLRTATDKPRLRIEGTEGATEGATETESGQEGSRPRGVHREVPAKDPHVHQVREKDGHTDVCGQEGSLRGRLGGGEGRDVGGAVQGEAGRVEQENQVAPSQVVWRTAWEEGWSSGYS